MTFIKIENNVVIQKQPYEQDGFLKTDSGVVCGMVHDGSEVFELDNFSNPAPDLSAYRSQYRDRRVYEGITVNGITVGTDDQTIDRLHKKYDVLKEWNSEGSANWKASSGWVSLNMAQIGAILQAIDEHVQRCFDVEMSLEDQSFSTKEEFEAAFDAAYEAA